MRTEYDKATTRFVIAQGHYTAQRVTAELDLVKRCHLQLDQISQAQCAFANMLVRLEQAQDPQQPPKSKPKKQEQKRIQVLERRPKSILYECSRRKIAGIFRAPNFDDGLTVMNGKATFLGHQSEQAFASH